MRKLNEAEENERLALYKQGMTDRQMADILFISIKSVTGWRKRRNLSANGGSGWGGNRRG